MQCYERQSMPVTLAQPVFLSETPKQVSQHKGLSQGRANKPTIVNSVVSCLKNQGNLPLSSLVALSSHLTRLELSFLSSRLRRLDL